MPAEKLTKHKLAQIIFMLIILSVAFGWRTATKITIPQVICAYAKKCYFRVNDMDMRLLPSKNSSSNIYTLEPAEQGWYISNNNRVYNAKGNKITLPLAEDDQPILYTGSGRSVDFSFEK